MPTSHDQLPLEPDTHAAESARISDRSPFAVGFGASFSAVALALLVVPALNYMDAIATRLVPQAGELVARVTRPGPVQSEPSVAAEPAAQLEPIGVEPSGVPLESSRLGDLPATEDVSQSAYEVEYSTTDFEDSLASPYEEEEEAPPQLEVSEPEPEPEIVRRTVPQLIRLPRPRYPMAARRQALRARVRVRVLIGVDGNVKEVKLAGKPVGTGFDEAALTAAKDTRWMPATENDVFIETWSVLVVEFEP